MPGVIALTGATGFIGAAVAHRLKTANCRIRLLVRSTSRRTRLSGVDACWVEGDLGDLESLRCLVRDAEAVVHCAGAVRGARREDFMRTNRYGVARLVQAASEKQPPPSFLLISSVAAREPHVSSYAASKRQGEEELVAGAGKMRWAVLRPPAVYGPGDKELLPLFRWMYYRGIAPMPGPDDSRFSLLYVDDLAEAVMRWLASDCSPQGVFELHDGKANGYGWNDLADTVARLREKSVNLVRVPVCLLELLASINVVASRVTGYAPMLTPGKLRELRHPNWLCDNTSLSRELGWTPLVSLEKGLRRTLQADR